ncbi:glycosyltransferase family 39 protein [Desulfatibacillum aliphaticivorans]|uniref:glycosyltransferase family 39 protein n=1 Tax=Desulfatibacillum aliphaticivorans TaxID=218208 RepID=UPI00040C5FA8|nr:glycosyltransferase family 39 protein [Desulfatibacillum aliphaticivorans]
MKKHYPLIEISGLAIAGCILFLFGNFHFSAEVFGEIAPHPLWASHGPMCDLVFSVWGMIFIALALAAFFSLKRKAGTLAEKITDWSKLLFTEAMDLLKWAGSQTQTRGEWAWIGAFVLIGAGIRVYFAFQPMRFDEAHTFLQFVNNGALYLFSYSAPNNHVLHTLFVKLSVTLFGTGPFAIRLPSIAAGVLCIPAVFLLTRLILKSRKSGFFAAALTAVLPYFILYSSMARGYTILCLLSICLAIAGLRLAEKPNLPLCFLYSLIISLGIFDVPTFLFPAAGITVWTAACMKINGARPKDIAAGFIAPCAVFSLSGALFLYTPVIIASNGVSHIISNKFVKAKPLGLFLGKLPEHLAQMGNQMALGLSPVVLMLLFIILALGLFHLSRLKNQQGIWLAPIILVCSLIILLAKRSIPFPRTWIYLPPFALVAMDAGYCLLAGKFKETGKSVLLVLSLTAAIVTAVQDPVTVNPATGYFPDAHKVVCYLSTHMKKGDMMIPHGHNSDATTEYYMYRAGLPNVENECDLKKGATIFYVTKKGFFPENKLGKNPTPSFETEDAEVFAVVYGEDAPGATAD